MPVDLRNSLRIRARTRTGRTLPLALLLVVLVIVAAGIGGTSHFTGARWFPHLGGARRTSVVTVPAARATAPPARPRPRHHSVTVPLWLVVLAMVVVVIGVAALLWRFWTRRRMPSSPMPHRVSAQVRPVVAAEPEPEPEALLTGIELALRALDEQRDPADAVVRAWLGLQETAEESGIVRHPAETPTEFTSRILSGAFADDRALRTLLRLYLRTRFGNHPPTTDDVTAVHDALQHLLANWRAAGGALGVSVR